MEAQKKLGLACPYVFYLMETNQQNATLEEDSSPYVSIGILVLDFPTSRMKESLVLYKSSSPEHSVT